MGEIGTKDEIRKFKVSYLFRAREIYHIPQWVAN